MGRFSKLWGTIGGSVIGVAVGLLATWGFAECTNIADVQTCKVAGFSAGQIYATSVMILGAIGTFFAPPNA